jgi:NAD(P)-dependent dehydrogenase (short-subunit alcohol dehydrogenase family)
VAEGARVVIGDLNVENASEAAAELGDAATAVEFDIADERSVDELVTQTIDALGGLDLVHVNAADLSAGTIGRDTDVIDVDLEVFDRTIAVNLRGHVLVARRALPELLATGQGAVVFTSSAAAFVPLESRPAYGTSKAALGALTRHLAARWGKDGIRANAVAPGYVLTEAMASLPASTVRDHAMSQVHSTRLGRPDDIAAAVAFLLSDDGEWINGQVLNVDGGTTMR